MAKMMKMPTVRSSLHRFDNEPSIRGPRSVFNLSHPHKTTFDAGFLVPVLCKEVLPGDTWAAKLKGFARLSSSALQRPIMDNLYWDTFWFFVPMRLVWANSVKFFGEQVNPGDSIAYVIPSITVPFTPAANSLLDYMGIFTATGTAIVQTPNAINCLPLRGYVLIYNQWFRDENLINSWSMSTGDGPDAASAFGFFKRAKRPDYFTSALPFLQKGVATVVPVQGTGGAPGAVPTWWNTGDGTAGAMQRAAAGANAAVQITGAGPGIVTLGWDNPNLEILINSLRQSVMIQEFLERDARGGTRYPELIEKHFGVENPDARVQRSEYLGGGSSPIIVSPISQTGQTGLTGGSTPLGNLAGVGSVFVDNHGCHKSFTEHGYIYCIANVRADISYQQGIEKMWVRSTRFDFYWREFAHLGEQAILNKEIYFQATTALNAIDNGVFGYTPRYEEYRFAFGRLSGKFRSQDATPIDNWHLAQEFSALPTLSQTFIEDDTTTILGSRILAVSTEPDILADLWFDIKVARPIPVYGIPGFAKRF